MTDQLACPHAAQIARGYDHFAPDFILDPYGFWATLRNEAR